MEQALLQAYAQNGKQGVGLEDFIDVVGPIYLDFAGLTKQVLLTSVKLSCVHMCVCVCVCARACVCLYKDIVCAGRWCGKKAASVCIVCWP